jgi:hypothetical protein
MLTNIAATILITMVTNTYAPKQYWHESNTLLLSNPPQSVSGEWKDEKPIWGQAFPELSITRDNPDVRITEVRRIKTLSFECDGRPFRIELENEIVSEKRARRIVETNEQWKAEDETLPGNK